MFTWEECVKELQECPADLNLISGLSAEAVVQGMSVWPYCDISLSEWKGQPPENRDERFEYIWGHVNFSSDKWMNLMGMIPPRGLVVRLILANLIFPDGTVNVEQLDAMRARLATDKLRAKLGGSHD